MFIHLFLVPPPLSFEKNLSLFSRSDCKLAKALMLAILKKLDEANQMALKQRSLCCELVICGFVTKKSVAVFLSVGWMRMRLKQLFKAASGRFLDRWNVHFVTPARILTIRFTVRFPIAGNDHIYCFAERRFSFKLDIQLGTRGQVPVHNLVNLCPVARRQLAVTAQLRLILYLEIHLNSSFSAVGPPPARC